MTYKRLRFQESLHNRMVSLRKTMRERKIEKICVNLDGEKADPELMIEIIEDLNNEEV